MNEPTTWFILKLMPRESADEIISLGLARFVLVKGLLQFGVAASILMTLYCGIFVRPDFYNIAWWRWSLASFPVAGLTVALILWVLARLSRGVSRGA